MKRLVYTLFSIGLALWICCASTGGGIKVLEPPESDRIMIIGNVVIENINQEFAFNNWGMDAEVVVIGRTPDGTVQHHITKTDNYGYYCLPNLPKGQYVFKSITLPIIGTRPVKIVNDRENSASVFYRMRHSERPISFTASWFPPPVKSRILNFDILWIGLRKAHIENLSDASIGEVLVAQSGESLKAKRFYDNGYPYTREDPLTYFKNRFPESDWWKDN